MSIERKLTAIMFTDIVGYSALATQDESLAMEILNKHDALIQPIIDRNEGRIIKHIGDAIFAIFDDVDKCAVCAIDIQSKLKKRNTVTRTKEVFQIRIGIHYGSVIPKDNDFFGNDVNICSRIEGLSSANCITATKELISELLFPDKVYSREIGYVKLKNINIPQNIYKIFLDKEEFANQTDAQLIESMKDNGCVFVDIDSYKINPDKSIMIDYINNIDGIENIEYIAHNLTKEIIDELNYVDNLKIPSFNQIIEFKGKRQTSQDKLISIESSNILTGSYKLINKKFHFNFEIFSSDSGQIIWSESFKIDKYFDQLKYNVIIGIINTLELNVPQTITDKFSKNRSYNKNAMNAYLRAVYLSEKSKEDTKIIESINLFDHALEMDINFIDAYGKCALLHFSIGNNEKALNMMETGLHYANKNKNKQELASINNQYGVLYQKLGKYSKAKAHYEKSLSYQLKLNNPIMEANCRSNLHSVYNFTGQLDEALEQAKIAIKLRESKEEYDALGISYANLANTYNVIGDYSEAIVFGRKSLAIFRNSGKREFEARILLVISQCYIEIGDIEKVFKYLKEVEIIIQNDTYRTGKSNDFLKGKIYQNKAEINVISNNYDEALNNYINASTLYQKIDNNLVYIKSLISQFRILIILHKVDINLLYDNIKHMIKKSDLSSTFKTNIESIDLYMDSLNDNNNGKQILDYYNNISKSDEIDPLDIWLLSKTFINQGQDNNAKKAKLLCNSLLKIMSKNIANSEHAKMFLKKGLLVSIINHKNVRTIINKKDTNHSNSVPSLYTYYAAKAMSAFIHKYDDLDKISDKASELAKKMIDKDKSLE